LLFVNVEEERTYIFIISPLSWLEIEGSERRVSQPRKKGETQNCGNVPKKFFIFKWKRIIWIGREEVV
jgi:hypothetical protein